MNQISFNKADIQLMKKYYDEGIKRQEIARRFNISESVLGRVFRENNIFKQRLPENIIGQKFNDITIIGQEKNNVGKTFFIGRCICGKITKTQYWILRKGLKRGCGCTRNVGKERLDKRLKLGEAACNARIYEYKYAAKKRNIPFHLSREEMIQLFSSDCYYCGNPPGNVRHYTDLYGKFVYNGIDRKDNSQGYTWSNCVAACKFCNFMKRNYTEQKFLDHVAKIYLFNNRPK